MARAFDRFDRGVLRTMVVFLALALMSATPAMAAEEASASWGRSSLKALTYKIMTTTANLAIYTAGTGSLVQGSVISGMLATYSFVTYTVSDYVWDTYYPPPAPGTAEFDAEQSAWRTTYKFVTYKAMNIPAIFAAGIYVMGDPVSGAALATALSVGKTGLFYLNNFAWDYYTSSAPPAPAVDGASGAAVAR